MSNTYDVMVPVVVPTREPGGVVHGWRYQAVRNVEAADEPGAVLVASARCVATYGLELSAQRVPTLVYPANGWKPGDLP